MTQFVLRSALPIAICITTSMAAAQSAHVHGEGRLKIAIEGNHLSMQLEFPGADIVGFEHQARSSDEKAAVTQATSILGDPTLLMRFDADANCVVQRASAEIEGEHEQEKHAEHDQHEGEETHGAFVAEYEFECADISALGLIEFTYFSQFSNAQSLDIVLIDGNGQYRDEIDRANPVLQLKK